MRSLLLAALVLLIAAPAADAVTPRQAAHRARACLRAHAWTAQLADGGVTVNAESRRGHWYSVAFNRLDGPTFAIVAHGKLTQTERRQARHCRRRALR